VRLRTWTGSIGLGALALVLAGVNSSSDNGSGSGITQIQAAKAMRVGGTASTGDLEGTDSEGELAGTQSVSVEGGRRPIVGATVVAYQASTTPEFNATQIGAAVTDSQGAFDITYQPSPSPGAIVYLVVIGGDAGSGENSAIKEMVVQGAYCQGAGCQFPTDVNINELTTLAATAALQKYITFVDCKAIVGNTQSGTCVNIRAKSGLARFASSVNALVDVIRGRTSAFLRAQPNSSPVHTTLLKLNTLANLMASCVDSTGPGSEACIRLFDQMPWLSSRNTLNAALEVASGPAANFNQSLYTLAAQHVVYQPVLTSAPSNWTLGGQAHAYVMNGTNGGGSSISAYVVDDVKGVLLPVTGSPFSTGDTQEGGAVAVDPVGKFLYVPNYNANAVAGYAIDPATGALSQLSDSPFPAGLGPYAVTVTPNGKFAYVTNFARSYVSAFRIDPATGTWTAVSGSPFRAGDQPESIAVDPTGRFLYVGNQVSQTISAYTINSSTGALSEISGSPYKNSFDPASIAVDPSGKFAYIVDRMRDYVFGFVIDQSTGALHYVDGSRSLAGTRPSSIIVSPSGKLALVTNEASNDVSIYAVDGTKLVYNKFGPAKIGFSPKSIAMDPRGNFAYVTNTAGNNVSAYVVASTIEGTTLVPVTTDSTKGVGRNPESLAVDPRGRFVYVANQGGAGVSAFRIDPITGLLSEISGSPFHANRDPSALAVHPSGEWLYVANHGCIVGNCAISAYHIDSVSGALSELNGSPFAGGSDPSSIAVVPDGNRLFLENDLGNTVSYFRINRGSGGLTEEGRPLAAPENISLGTGVWAQIAPRAVPDGSCAQFSLMALLSLKHFSEGISLLPFSSTPRFFNHDNPYSLDYNLVQPDVMAISPNGRFVYIADLHDFIYHINGVLLGCNKGVSLSFTLMVPEYVIPHQPTAITVDPFNRFVYLIDEFDDKLYGFKAAGNGDLSPIDGSPFGSGRAPFAVAEDRTGRFAYVTRGVGQPNGAVSGYAIDQSSGRLYSISLSSPFASGATPGSVAVGP